MAAKNWVRGCLTALAVVMLTAGIGVSVAVEQSRRELDEQKRLAKAVGIPLTVEELVARLPEVRPEDNAAPLLAEVGRRLAARRNEGARLDASTLMQRLRANQATLSEVRKYLASHQDELRLMEQAAAKPSCRFDRDWSQGMAVLFPEYAGIKAACHLLSLRAWVALAEGRDEEGLADLTRIRKIAAHVRREPVQIGYLMATSCDVIAMRVAADALYRRPDRAPVRAFMKSTLAEPSPDWALALGTDVLFMDLFYGLMERSQGWRDMGLDSPPQWWETSFLSAPLRWRGRAAVWRSGRLQVEALSFAIGPEADKKRDEATQAGYGAFLAGPTAFQVAAALSAGELGDPRELPLRFRTTYEAFLSAIATGKDAEFVAPEWKEVRSVATWKGKQLTITTTAPGQDPSTLKFPGDPPKR